ncbi:hypothetical protein ACI79J_17760 [Geodermatophilus sp. SYSU D01062]
MLVLALVIITVVAVAVAGLLSFSTTSLRNTVAVRAQAASVATAEGAAQAAINTLKQNGFNNDTTAGSAFPKCFGADATSDQLQLSNLVPGTTGSASNSAAVQCTALAGTGVDGGLVKTDEDNTPGQAILTLSNNPAVEQGLYIKPKSSSVPFIVNGRVTSASNINVDGGEMKVSQDVYASACAGTITVPATATKTCNGSSSTVVDPGAPGQPQASDYTPDSVDFSVLRTVPSSSSCSAGSLLTFSPGYYKDGKALTDLTNSNSCKDSVFWFKPGAYYFDFQNTATSSGVSDPHQWVVGVGQLVAGTPTNTAGSPIAQPPVPAIVPGACLNPLEDPALNMGVQFIFGGDSQFRVAGTAQVEICGSYHADRPPIAVSGIRTTTVGTPTTLTGLTATAAKSTGSNAFNATTGNGTNALRNALNTVDTNYAAWTTAKPGDSATLTASPYLSSSIPKGSTITSARMRIFYGTANAASTRSIKVTPTYGATDGTPFTMPVDASAQGAGLTPVPAVDITSEMQAAVDANLLTGITVDYTTTMAATGSEQINAVFLDLTYTPPGFRASSGCVTLPYSTTGGSGCALISTTESFSGKFYIQGTTYAPLAAIDISLSSVSEQVMRFGVISRTLAVKETGGFSYTGAVIEVRAGSGFGFQGTVVDLAVYVCEGNSTCSIATGKRRLNVRVYIKAPNTTRTMVIQSWAVVR